jgi:hypothetical protein
VKIDEADRKRLTGLGGWLVLVMLRMIFAVISTLAETVRFIDPAEQAFGAILCAAILTLIVLAARHSPKFPISYAWFMGVTAALSFVGSAAEGQSIQGASMVIAESIWIAYVLRSKRCYWTFRAPRVEAAAVVSPE